MDSLFGRFCFLPFLFVNIPKDIKHNARRKILIDIYAFYCHVIVVVFSIDTDLADEIK